MHVSRDIHSRELAGLWWSEMFGLTKKKTCGFGWMAKEKNHIDFGIAPFKCVLDNCFICKARFLDETIENARCITLSLILFISKDDRCYMNGLDTVTFDTTRAYLVRN